MASELLAELESVVDGLLYISETDARWEAFHWTDATGRVTPTKLKKRGGHPARAAIESQNADEFFEPLCADHDSPADAARYREVKATLERLTCGLQVIRVGEVKVMVYVIGEAAEGGWAGIRAAAVET